MRRAALLEWGARRAAGSVRSGDDSESDGEADAAPALASSVPLGGKERGSVGGLMHDDAEDDNNSVARRAATGGPVPSGRSRSRA